MRFTTGLLILAAAAGCRSGDATPPDEAAVTPAVEAVLARAGTLPLEERLSGAVKAENQVSVRPEITATVVEVLVRSGDAVERGQPLVRLQDDALREQLRQSEASVELQAAAAKAAEARAAEVNAQAARARALAKEQLVSPVDLETQEAQLAVALANADEARARVEQARATRDERQAALTKTVVRAPVAGRVGRRNAEIGMLADPSGVLFEIGNFKKVIVEVPLTGEMLRHIKAGQAALVSSPVLGPEPLRATLSRISPFLAAGSFSTLGEVDVANAGERLQPGMFVTVDVLYGETEEATVLPTSAVWDDPRSGVRGVFVVEGFTPATAPGATPSLSVEPHAVAFRPVEVLAEGRASTGVRGVAAGEWVVTVGHHLLATDAPARARVRAVGWERVLDLQTRQREDLLRGFLDKQRLLAQSLGAAPPSNEAFLSGGTTATPRPAGGN